MDWSRLQHQIPFEKNFRWRGGQVSRIEGFADAVFALSVTLLLVSTEVPGSYAELIATMKALPAFALSFLLLLMVWYFHFIHFRRYGLEDFPTMFLNLILLFFALLYVYPLKFMFAFLQGWAIDGMDTALIDLGLSSVAVGNLLAVYGAGFAVMYLVLALMAAHAMKLRDPLELNEIEVEMTRSLVGTHAIMVAVGMLSAVLALALPDPLQGTAGFAYFLLPILHTIYGRSAARKEAEALARMQGEGETDVGAADPQDA